MNSPSSKYKIIAAALTVAALVIFNRGLAPTRSTEQVRFDTWLSAVEPQLIDGDPPRIEVALTLPGAAGRMDVSSKTSAAQALRLLQLVREGNLLSLGSARSSGDAEAAPPADKVALMVRAEQQNFLAWIDRASLEGRPQGQLMLKLSEVFAQEQQAGRAAQHS
jgi:hypothetical protein